MAKRSNPFIEDFVQQSKIHVGTKQFNNNEDRLKKVYEKTLELLFKGAKKPAQEVTNVADDVPHNRKDKMKQLSIGKDGCLIHTGIIIPENTAARQECSCGNAPVEGQCAYCDTQLCSACQHYCVSCERYYCIKCFFVGSGCDVCVSCYG